MVITMPNNTGWETFPCRMNIDNHNWALNTKNEEYNQSIENIINIAYTKSFCYKMYHVDVRSDNGVVFFYNLSKRQIHRTERFTVFSQIPENTKTFFRPIEYWDELFGPEWPEWFKSQQISGLQNGTLSNNTSTTNTPLYTPPFSVTFRAQGIEQNFMRFNRFYKANVEETILTMMAFDPLTNTLQPFFDPYLFIPYKDNIFNQDLEFKILDSNKRHVTISDNSQLFIILTLL
jgi:hypothetical protein